MSVISMPVMATATAITAMVTAKAIMDMGMILNERSRKYDY